MLKNDDNNLAFRARAEAFPQADPGASPFGDRVLVQLRRPRKMSSGGIALTEDTQDFEQGQTSIGKVISMGPLAFRDRDTMEPWPEGVWASIGDFIRVPRHGGDKWDIKFGDGVDDYARFSIIRDREVIALITADPLSFKDYV